MTFPLYVEVDEIYHLACPASPVYYQRDPVQTTKTSVIGSINMLGLAKRTKAKILLASTSEVYGDPEIHPQREDYWGNVNPIGIRSCYDEGKRCAETLVLRLPASARHADQGRADLQHLRAPHAPDDGRVVSNFIMSALRGEPLTIYGDGTQTRSFCYVDDLVDGLMALMATSHEVTGPVNIGNPHEVTVGEFAETVNALVGSGGGVEYRNLPADDPTRRRPDITVAKDLLGWEPSVGMIEGLTATIDYFRRELARDRLDFRRELVGHRLD